ncbi:MAG: hypothetical protein LBF15_06365 [Candidatus Peribacteria bacterium]|jgi:hypothetical protein|nr:hypothetical protein [Candidatus Peribacteria bacterium]
MSSLLWVTSENLSKLEEKQRKSKKYLSSEEVQFLNAFVQERIKGTI